MKPIWFFVTALLYEVPLVRSHCYFQVLSPCTPDYYWRDYYHGIIPKDAVEGGRDSNGNPTYVAQGLFRYAAPDYSHNEPLVTSVRQGDLTVKGLGHGAIRETDKNIKILCGPYKENFEWRSVKNNIFPSLSHTHVIVGGAETEKSDLFIGRVLHEGNLVVGKVYNDSSPYKGIWVPQGQGQINYSSYEILTFRCGVKLCYN